jgi:type I restriction enzyme S subunit
MTKYLRAANVKDGTLELDDVKSMNFDPAEQGRFALSPGDVLVTEGSGSLGAVGASAVWREEIDDTVCFQNTLLRLRPRPSTDPAFLGWWCRYAFADGIFASIATGANIHHISAERVRSLPMSYLGLEEQRAIVDYLDTETARINAVITKKRRLIDLLELRRWSLLDQLMAGSVSETTSLKRLASTFTDGDWIESPYIVGSGIRLIQTGNIGRGQFRDHGDRYISEETFRELKCTEVLPGDVLISRLANTVGQACVAPDLGCRMVTSVDVVILRPVKSVSSEFLVRYLSSDRHLSRARLEARGTTMQRLARSQVGELPVPVLPLDEQSRLVSRDGEVTPRLVEAGGVLAAQIELLIEHRQALITVAVTGDLAIPGAAA